MSNQTTQPLAKSQTGDPIELPATAATWRVRRLNGGPKGGAPEVVYGQDGLPLTIDIATPAADFPEMVERQAGKYRLDAQDEQGRIIAGTPPAYVMVAGAAARHERGGDGAELGRSFDVIERTTKTMADAMDRQSAQLASLISAVTSLVKSVDRPGMRNDAAPVLMLPPAVPTPTATPAQVPGADAEMAQPPQPSALDKLIEMAMPFIGPMLPQIGMALMAKLAPFIVAPPAGAPPPAAGGGA